MTQKEKQYAYLTVGVVGALLLYQFVVDPFFQEYEQTKTKLDNKHDEITKAQTLFGTERQKQKAWETMLAQGLKNRLEDAQSQAFGAVSHWAAGAGVNLSEQHGEPVPRQEGRFLISTYKFTGLGNMRAISRWLQAIEKGTVPPTAGSTVSGRIPLRIDDLVITPRKPGQDDLQAVVTISTLCLIPDQTPAAPGAAPKPNTNNTDNTRTGPVAQAGAWGGRS